MGLHLLAALAFPLAVFAQGAPPADYAVVSLIGDRFTVAGQKTYATPVDGAIVDAVAAAIAKEELDKELPGASVVLAVVREPAVYAAQEQVLALTQETQSLIDALEPVISKLDARKLVLISKIRAPVKILFADADLDRAGMLEGVGFYVAAGEHPYLGVFAHVRVSLVDLKTRRVEDEEKIVTTVAIRDPRKNPWDSLTAEQKAHDLKDITTRELRKAMPRLLSRAH
jgi:hypothetical protein